MGVSGGRGSALHSVTGRWEGGALAGGVAVFRFCNDVTITVNIREGKRQGLCVGKFKDQVIFVTRKQNELAFV